MPAVAAPRYFIGLMSGTSMDAADAALVDFHTIPPTLVATHHSPLPAALRKDNAASRTAERSFENTAPVRA